MEETVVKEMAYLLEQMGGIKAILINVQENTNSMQRDINSIHEEINEMREDINSIHEEINEMHEDINSIHEEINEMREDINSIHEEINEMHEEINSIKEDLESTKKEMREGFAECNKRMDRIEKKIDANAADEAEIIHSIFNSLNEKQDKVI